jgi:hypothetical protein
MSIEGNASYNGSGIEHADFDIDDVPLSTITERRRTDFLPIIIKSSSHLSPIEPLLIMIDVYPLWWNSLEEERVYETFDVCKPGDACVSDASG